MHFKFLKKILRIIAIILPCFLFTFVFSSSSYAVSNISVTLDENNNYAAANVPVFSSCNDVNCLSQYKYFHIKCENCTYTYSNARFNFRNMSGLTLYINTFYEVADSTVIEFTSGIYLSPTRHPVWTFELLTELPSDCAPAPSGSLSISSNGTYDVSSYETAVVNVPAEVIQGDYHDDLVSINNTIVLIPAVALVIYFFFAIYRLLIGGF